MASGQRSYRDAALDGAPHLSLTFKTHPLTIFLPFPPNPLILPPSFPPWLPHPHPHPYPCPFPSATVSPRCLPPPFSPYPSAPSLTTPTPTAKVRFYHKRSCAAPSTFFGPLPKAPNRLYPRTPSIRHQEEAFEGNRPDIHTILTDKGNTPGRTKHHDRVRKIRYSCRTKPRGREIEESDRATGE
ncbi:hypothetical protein IE53DRAFT_229969 [Violaceomyces palustris]|uniref:Uncharacterized protein n=1 Tax=Violaceomyces palustris TaxID=1673888 RepID=A0ACD0NPP9_9BASI|nr:hypothetical protein IE53DRAFT_229969 [Violaceomyces palustris]